jgi:hypothetical protein
MKETKPKEHSRISKDARVTRVVNLKMLGLTEAQISTTMENEGYKHVSREPSADYSTASTPRP